MLAEYWFNTHVREKYFDGYLGGRLVYVGTIEVSDLNHAFEAFNRTDSPNLVLDEAEAPSMSVGDVVHVAGTDDWFVVAKAGFSPIPPPPFYMLAEGDGVRVSDYIY